MKNAVRHIIVKTVIFSLITSFTAFFSGCGGEADTITPSAISVSASGTVTGTVYPRIVSVYPDGSTNPQVDTQIVIVFSKQIDISTIVDPNITVTGGTAVTVLSGTSIANGYGVVLNLSAATLDPGTAYTVNITTAVTDTDGFNLSSAGTYSFTTASSTASAEQPRVIAATQFPTGTGVGIDLQYVEVTFTESVTNVDGYFTISPNIASGSPTSSDNKTWRLPVSSPSYGVAYTVTLTTDIYKLGDATSTLYDDGNLTWTFTMQSDPASVAYTIDDIWVDSVTETSAVIKVRTSKQYLSSNLTIEYGTTLGGPYPSSASNGDATLRTLHTVTLTPLTAGTVYYFRGWLTTEGVYSGEYSFRTRSANTALTDTSDLVDKEELVLIQTSGLGSYAFWVRNNSDVYGQYFNTSSGAPDWTDPGGEPISTSGGQNGIVAITDGFAEAVVIYNDSNNLYAKMVYDSSGTFAFRWGGGVAAQGTSLGLAIKAGSSYSACIVHENPDIICSGTATMPDNGTATNLLYDVDVDFSAYSWLTAGDLLLTNTWTEYTISDQGSSPYDIFPYVLKSSGNTNLGVLNNYYIVDSAVTVTQATGVADSGTTTTELRSSTNSNFLLVKSGDIIKNETDTSWGFATADGAWNVAGYYYISIAGGVASLSDGDNFTIYRNHAGPFTSEAVTNPLWDTSATFSPGTTVLEDDFVVNENNNTAVATYARVSAITASDSDYALRLTSDIMNDTNIYSIVRLPDNVSFLAADVSAGYSTNVGTNFNLTDGNSPFLNVALGDIVFNIDQNMSAMVTGAGAVSLTLTADIFNSTNEKAIIFRKRGFLVMCVNASDYIVARAFNIADGTALGAAFNVCTNGTNSSPVAVSDGAGNAIIFYEKGGSVYVKKVSAKGGFVWSNAAANSAAGAGIQIAAATGYTIVKALPDRSTGASSATGGAYLLVHNSAGSIRLIHVAGSDGTLTTVATIAGYDPQMAVDNDSGTYNRVIIVYRASHIVGSTTFYHISAVSYRRGGLVWAAINVSSNSAAYNCYKPLITMADNTTAADAFYVSWFDGRYFNLCGYSIYARGYTAALAQLWSASAEKFVSMPTTMGYDNGYNAGLLYWNDGASLYGLMPVWLDYRNSNTDIYYEQMTAP